MTRYLKTPVTQLSANESAALQQINKNLDDIQNAIQDTVSRSGMSPTQMTADLDLNGKRIINAPAPLTDNDFVRRVDVVGDVAMVQSLVNTASTAAGQAIAAAEGVQEAIADAHVGIVADDLMLGDDSKIRIAANNIDSIDACVDNIEDISAVGDNISNVNAVADNETNINAVNNNKTNIDAVAGNKTNIDTVAGISTDVSTVADNASDIGTVATNVSDISDCADNMSSITGASTQAANAAASAQSAASSAEQAAISAAGSHFKLFHHDWFDYQLNDMAWLRADTFSWQDGTVYSEAYNHLVDDYDYIETTTAISLDGDTGGIPAGSLFYRYSDGDTTHTMTGVPLYAWKSGVVVVYTYSETPLGDAAITSPSATGSDLLVDDFISGKQSYSETIGSYTITYYLAADGHKIILPDMETTATNIYNESGVAWYYILDTTNQRFKLPRTKWGFVGLRDGVGKYVEAGLPNIGGTLQLEWIGGTGSFYKNATSTSNNRQHSSTSSVNGTGFDASSSSSIYGNSATVQPPATQMYLYFYVGQFSQSAIEQTAGLNSELFNGKVDLNAANLSTAGKSLISGLGMPSNRYIDLTLGASGSTYTAPANGWVMVGCTGTAGSTYFEIVAENLSACASYNGGWGRAMAPIKKNQTFTCYYGGTGFTKQMFRFCYAEGETNV